MASTAVNNAMPSQDPAISAEDKQLSKKQKTESSTPKSPYGIWQQRIKSVMDATNAMELYTVRGPGDFPRPRNDSDNESDDEDDDDDSEERNQSPESFSQQQVDYTRVIVLTPERSATMDDMAKLVLGEQYGECMLMFSTSFAWETMDNYQVMKCQFDKIKSWPKKLNLLLGFTVAIKENDCWMHDNEGELEDMIEGLAKMWKRVLKKSNDDLEIDGEFTRPGIDCLLEEFKKEVEQIATYDDSVIPFKYL